MKHDPPVRLSTDGKLGADLHPRFNDHARGDGHLVLGGQARVPGPAGLYSIHTSKGTTRCRPRHTRTPLSRRHREVNHVRLRRRRHSPTGTVTAATRRVDTRPALQAGVMRGCLTIALWATVLAGLVQSERAALGRLRQPRRLWLGSSGALTVFSVALRRVARASSSRAVTVALNSRDAPIATNSSVTVSAAYAVTVPPSCADRSTARAGETETSAVGLSGCRDATLPNARHGSYVALWHTKGSTPSRSGALGFSHRLA